MNSQFLLVIFIMVFCFQMTACESQEFRSYQTQRLENLSATSRVEVEKDIVAHNAFFDTFTGSFPPKVWRGHDPDGEFHSEIASANHSGFFVDSPNIPTFYGVGFFHDFSVEQDQFLSIYLSSDHDYTEYGRDSSPSFDLFVPRLYVCDQRIQAVELALIPNDNPAVSDGEFHYVAQTSIPILISRGLISQPQKPLCLTTVYAFSEPAWGGDYYIWEFNDIRIEPYEIQAVMNGLKAQGIEYVYPVDPIYY